MMRAAATNEACSDLWGPIDPLGEALHYLRMSGMFYCRSELTAPWGLALPPMEGLSFHVVTSGQCWLDVDGLPPRRLEPGDLVLLPHGEGHRLSTEAGGRTIPIDQLPQARMSERYGILRHGGGGAATELVCGAVRFDHPAAHHVVRLLPQVIHIDSGWSSQTGMAGWMRSTLQLLAAECRELRPGGEAIITRLADVLVVQAIRTWMERDPSARTGWLAALHDPRIGRALLLVHREPARDWSVESLATEAGMSRSGFAARFTELVGEPAMQYVTRWRMLVALTWLNESDASASEMGHRLGYQSEAAFNRAFKRILGTTPGAARRQGLRQREA
ncbi:MAG TPA: AraC family transcriptional regulator [Polyangiaceae bacterium]|nr:AraC family transcriptional regulator [Polyangiaceae bacterium]